MPSQLKQILDFLPILWAFVAAITVELCKRAYQFYLLRGLTREVETLAKMVDENARNDFLHADGQYSRRYAAHILNETLPLFRLLPGNPAFMCQMMRLDEEKRLSECAKGLLSERSYLLWKY